MASFTPSMCSSFSDVMVHNMGCGSARNEPCDTQAKVDDAFSATVLQMGNMNDAAACKEFFADGGFGKCRVNDVTKIKSNASFCGWACAYKEAIYMPPNNPVFSCDSSTNCQSPMTMLNSRKVMSCTFLENMIRAVCNFTDAEVSTTVSEEKGQGACSDTPLNGEQACQIVGSGQGALAAELDESACLQIGCCQWDGTTDGVGRCASAVGTNVCENSSGSGAAIPAEFDACAAAFIQSQNEVPWVAW